MLICPVCTSSQFSLTFTYTTPPKQETDFGFAHRTDYHREIWQCQWCGHFINQHQLHLQNLYKGDYVNSTYGVEKLLPTFQRIMALPPEHSDNYQRVERITSFMTNWFDEHSQRPVPPKVLDIGSGLGVFPARMKAAGWACTALDPDLHAIEHIRQHIGVEVICGDFMTVLDQKLGQYDLIAFNKVLEHVPNPIAMLNKSRDYLAQDGIIYVEVPDGELAQYEGPNREEFFIEHCWIFSMTSLSLLATRAGLTVRLLERIHEPSSKYTLRAFLTNKHLEITPH